MWRKRRFFRVGILSAFAFIGIYYVTTQIYTIKYRTRRKAGLPGARAVLAADEQLYVRGAALAGAEGALARHAFNLTASDSLPSDRPLPDTRHPRCGEEEYEISPYQTTSVIIAFHNEARSALLRTVVSVLNRTPPDLLEEVILVDDFSSNEQDGLLLASLSKVKVVRNEARKGLIRSRVRGAAEARGHFLVFLDSHCEVNIGWLEPLLATAQDQVTVACPVIDVIDLDTFQYRSSSMDLKGGFDWGLHFKWIPLSETDKEARYHPFSPFSSPVVPGGLFLVSREWFSQLGAFDAGLEVWGAESLEISLKTWLCGGRLLVVPCSRVGHVFRKKHPYTFPDGNAYTYLRNTKRIADVWLDEYKQFFYEAKPNAKDISSGSLDERLSLKSRLDCKPFQWFLENVFPELRLPNEENTAFGQLRQGSQCLQSSGEGSEPHTATCSDTPGSQHSWAYNSRSAQVLSAKLCLTFDKRLTTEKCRHTHNQTWSRHGRAVVHLATGACLETGLGREVRVRECRRGAIAQQWDFTVELQSQGDTAVNIT
ncbi:polypeptide N-acetylgalactosaminyltransferase 16-like [Bacillus rossius redtenbacheri]|uniref:polypeptide N-acetylgalactosaminyltransferase 16-like n=1 Tax=Bacillus rossius redtenbacheri TaxID=93214 RepID=UPI002FDE424A